MYNSTYLYLHTYVERQRVVMIVECVSTPYYNGGPLSFIGKGPTDIGQIVKLMDGLPYWQLLW